MSVCKSCNAKIIWVVTENGRQMPLDFDPSPDGTFRKERVEGEKKIVHKLRQVELEANTRPLYQSHFETCPDRDEHRKKGPTH